LTVKALKGVSCGTSKQQKKGCMMCGGIISCSEAISAFQRLQEHEELYKYIKEEYWKIIKEKQRLEKELREVALYAETCPRRPMPSYPTEESQ
jgi:hypothetical protein